MNWTSSLARVATLLEFSLIYPGFLCVNLTAESLGDLHMYMHDVG